MPRTAALRPLDHAILTHLGRLRFATAKQLAYWCDTSAVSVYKRLPVLAEQNLVAGEEQVRPAIWRLTFAGARIINKPMPAGRRHASWSVMAHACHVHEVELLMREQYRGFRFFDRFALLKQGFNPAHGEHAGADDAQQSIFILVDDYLMGSDRIPRAWHRRHAPNKKYWKDPTGKVWGEVMQRFLVASTDPRNAESHRTWIANSDVPADVITVPALWS